MKIKGFKFKSLTMRIWATFTIVILLIILCLSLLYMFIYRVMDTNNKAQDLLVAHDMLLVGDPEQPVQFAEIRNLRGSIHFIYTINADGTASARDIGPPMPKRVLPGGFPTNRGSDSFDQHERNRPQSPPMPDGGRMPPVLDDPTLRDWLVSFIPAEEAYAVEFNKYFRGVNFIFIISKMSDSSALISYMPNLFDNKMMYYILAIGCVFIAIGFVVSKVMAGYISKPLFELERFTLRIAKKDWGKPISLKNEDELGRLASSMNEMQEALKRADDEEKLFLQSISHDLKTPVMVIMAHADAIIDGVYIDTLGKTAQIIKDEAIRLNKKIKQLLYLNTLDYVLENQTETSTIRLDLLVKEIMGRFEIMGSGINWSLDCDNIEITGDSEKCTVAIENILDNALRYAKTEISVSLKSNGEAVRLEIFNDGDPINPERLERIFDSMYKEKTGNFGLGLAISKKIITFFGGSIHAENRQNGISFIIDFKV